MSYHTPGPWKIAAILSVAALAGCEPLDAIEGKSPGREHVEMLSLVMMPVVVETVVVVATVEPVPAPVEPEPVLLAIEPECIPVFRVTTCP